VSSRLYLPFVASLILCTVSVPLLVQTGFTTGMVGRKTVEEPAAEERWPLVEAMDGPYLIAVQPGHWKIDELPAEQARRERSSGAAYAGVREADINLAVVDALVPLLEEEGWEVVVVPATVPPGLRADAFISIHADWGASTSRSGWKLSPPWRPSEAATSLANALKESFGTEPELNEDVGGVTVGMRGYFGFASNRYTHASSPYTPAVLIELGFVTNTTERIRMVTRPEYYAELIHRGLRLHFARWTRIDVSSLIPRVFTSMVVGVEGATAHVIPDKSAATVRELPAGSIVRPVDKSSGWFEISLRNPRVIGWVSEDDLVELN